MFLVLMFYFLVLGIELPSGFIRAKKALRTVLCSPEQLKTIMDTCFGEHTYEKT